MGFGYKYTDVDDECKAKDDGANADNVDEEEDNNNNIAHTLTILVCLEQLHDDPSKPLWSRHQQQCPDGDTWKKAEVPIFHSGLDEAFQILECCPLTRQKTKVSFVLRHYMYIETSSFGRGVISPSNKQGDKAILESSVLAQYPASCLYQLVFFYNMYGNDTGSLVVKMKGATQNLWSLTGQHSKDGFDWKEASVTLDVGQYNQVRHALYFVANV
ncbi:MAM and LDL-receptor class a domain-containing protein 1 [Plakobranchus ocellatus]|uniref:MAM and LDL-receptor class a domain-containing protein 1 n=1 Tax=Plakobranchus ocellatus TaxID=259542 RepID=A0AAV4A368_9GAST|nr:MAM and LDL-receptor class a domain-containing protein 1 [Plakobranchus ocellatus]